MSFFTIILEINFQSIIYYFLLNKIEDIKYPTNRPFIKVTTNLPIPKVLKKI